MKTSSQRNDPEFAATERAYGGAKGYAQALAAGRTKLSYQQWIQVRTPAFKAQFGDWEALRAQEQIDAMSPIQVRVPDDWRRLDHVALREKMAEALDRMVRERTEIAHHELGLIRVGRLGAKKSKGSARDPAKSLVVADIETLIPAAIYARSEPSHGGDGPDIAGYSTLLARVSVDDVPLVAAFTVRHQSDGRWYYNAVTLHDGPKRDLEKEKAQDSYGRPDHPEDGSSIAPITGLNSYIRQSPRRVNTDTASQAADDRRVYSTVTLKNGQEKTPAVSPRDTPEQVGERATSANTEVSSYVRRPLRRVNPDSVSKAIDLATGEPLLLYRSADNDLAALSVATKESLLRHRGSSVDATKASERSGSSSAGDAVKLLHDAPNFNGEVTKATTSSSDMAHPVFLNARALDGETDHIHDGNAWLVLDPAQILSAAGNSYPLGRDDPTTVKANLSAGDQPMANPIQNESTVYGEPKPVAPNDHVVRDTLPDLTQEDAFLANELLVDENPLQAIASPSTPTPEDNHEQIKQGLGQPTEKDEGRTSAIGDRRDDGRSAGQHEDPVNGRDQAQRDSEKTGLSPTARKRAKKATSDAQPSPAPKEEKPKRARSTKAKDKAASTPEPAAPQPAPSPAPAPKGVAALDPHAQQRLDRVATNRAADLAEAKKKLDADAMNRAKIHLLQDPIGRHIVTVDLGGVTKAYAVDENPGIAAKTVNSLREGMRKLGSLANEIGYLPDVIKTRFRLKSGEEKIAYNVDPEGVDPRHPHMREAGLGENDRRNLVVIPDGNPDEISKKVLLSTDLPDDVRKRFVYSDTVPGQYFDRSRKLAFIDKGGRLATDQNTPEIIASMVSVAQAKGWKAITVKGHEDFQREAWLAASLAGIEVKGFKPKAPDLARLEYERQVRMGNAIQAAALTPTPVANEISGTTPEKQSPEISPEAVALGEVARLKGVREDQIPNFVKAAQAFIDQAKRDGIDLPALKIFDPKAPSTPAVATPEKTREPRSIDNPHPEKAPKR